MAKTRQFDMELVLNRALAVFRELGYEATSVDDLSEATGLGKGSLYAAFESKEGLFLHVLDFYRQKSDARFKAALENSSLVEAISDALQVFFENLTDADNCGGCLVVQAAENSEIKSRRIRRKVVAAFSEEEQAFYERLRKACSDGELSPATDVRALARFLSAQTRAMGVTARISDDPQVLKDIMSVALTTISARTSIAANTASAHAV
ncbi:TetR/AcrR family transcriptional regulator [Pseudahrensia aquimaris]|uniref:TetR/AcrR family transcriptional regulator n=1 Tax=Pseudahrensia aquimaris TaxID=744461 RepID=A0ABW3FF20_9HYPH